jgi:antitoxin (DNA-binding transcriptional repressor) of toxin-antitoxin stability system
MDKNGWNVGEAKQQFSEVLRRSENEPQLIYRRKQLIAAVVSVDEAKARTLTKNKTIAERLAEVREIFRQENYRLPKSRRTTRENAFVKVLDELADGHKRS